jgi:hypothetical protein
MHRDEGAQACLEVGILFYEDCLVRLVHEVRHILGCPGACKMLISARTRVGEELTDVTSTYDEDVSFVGLCRHRIWSIEMK